MRGNARPGIVAALVAALVFGVPALVLLLRALLAAGPPPAAGVGRWIPVGIALALMAAGLIVTAAVVVATSLPRLVHEGGRVRVRLSPWRSDTVPLGVVECFFLGSRLEPPRPGDTMSGGHRVRTLVMRIAERAHEHAGRPTLAAWGDWKEGSVTFDGRWCEPLSVDLARRLNRDLAAAKREAVEPAPPPTPGARA